MRLEKYPELSPLPSTFHFPAIPEGSIRLAGSDNNNEGRVEILYNGRWGTICDTDWSDADGIVACNQLGLDSGSVDTSYSGM